MQLRPLLLRVRLREDVREPEPEAGDGGLGVQRPVVPTSMFILTQPIYLSNCLFAN